MQKCLAKHEIINALRLTFDNYFKYSITKAVLKTHKSIGDYMRLNSEG